MKFTLKTTILLSLMFFSLILTNGCTNKETLNAHSINTPNPWTNCNQDLSCAAKIAGFKFPIKITDIQISAMKGMIEINYPLDKSRTVTIRKTTEENYNKFDISGDYNNYPIRDSLKLDNGVELTVRRDNKLIYVAYLGAEAGFYSINCPKGLTKQEIQNIYDIIAKAESNKF